ncbi:EspA/EspE family type VII secretion system effector [Mycobacterium kyorinense]|uniref:EspA/EspE family type VII secretion system effector n=1 Tax=Mycobacterium kyorinense TaxID=487514 RepID=UPI000B05F7AF|nr:EspA/EspE family type VII secretion system effector [Mycobacterium kyorinense]
MGDGPNEDAGLQKFYDLLGVPEKFSELLDAGGGGAFRKSGKALNNLNDGWKALDHLSGALDGNPKDIVDLFGDLGSGVGKGLKLKSLPDTLKTTGRMIEAAGKKAGIEGLEQFGKQLFSKAGSKWVSGLAGAETPIIDAALLALTLMSLQLGFGDPDSGDRFGNGSTQFQQVYELLDSAFPNGWAGAGSQAYTKQNTKQQGRAEIMAHADNMMHGIVQEEARQLTETQTYIDVASDFLMACIPAAIALYAVPVVGPEMSLAFQAGAVAGAMPLPTARMAQMVFQAMQNAAQVQQAIGKYNEVASTAHSTGAPSAFCPSPGTPGSPSGTGTSGTPGGPGKSGSPTGPGRSGSPSGPTKPSSPSGPGQSDAPSTPGTPSAPTAPGAPTMPPAPSGPTAPSMPSQPPTPTAPSTPASPGTPSTRNVPWVTTTPSGGATPVATAFSAQTGGGGLASTTPPAQPVTPGAGPAPSVPKPPGPQMVPGARPDPSKLPPIGRAPVSHEIETDTDQVKERAT